ncbi:MAG: MGMT family protein [Deltaproteobacteria bacterium]|nr:MGMT family protein [Deltaproteobacteria bacterium]
MRGLLGAIPAGRVATYGQLAALAGHPRRARMVGRLLAELPEDAGLPWHRVINAAGRIPARLTEAGQGREEHQARLLAAEGVAVNGLRVDIRRHGWRPEEGALFTP